MNRYSIPTMFLLITLILGACGSEATPTASPVDLQATISSGAFTVIAETQAAIPTSTPIPPTATFTNTPLPTLTFIPLSPPAGTGTPVPNGNSGSGDPCINKTLPQSLQGDPVRIRLNNSTKATLSVTVYLNQSGPNTVCGYRSYTIDPGQFIVLNDLVVGCYTIWAWNPDPASYFISTNGTSCVDTSKSWVFDISTSSITPEY
jgi:hypothetical protein